MFIRLYFFILLIIFLEPAANCKPDLFENLNEQQAKLLNSFSPCVIRMVFLENSYSASLKIHSFLNYYENKATFILESIPVDFRGYNTYSKLALTRVKDLKFRICYVIFYFQDQITEAAKEKVHLSPTSIICEYFKKFTVHLRNENPTFINFITFQNVLTFSSYDCLENIDTTSVIYRLATKSADRVFINYRTPMRISSNFRWDNRWSNSLDACAVPLKRIKLVLLDPKRCLFQEAKQRLNITQFTVHIGGAYSIVNFAVIERSAVKSKFHNNTNLKFEFLSYGMVVKSFKFGTVARPIGYDIYSLIEPFDISTWILLFASTLSLCFYFRVAFELLGKRSFLGTHVLSVLLEQSQDIVTNCKRLNKEASFLIILWLLLTFLVANAYKGVLFTILTTPSFQIVPQTVQEILQSNYSVWTFNAELHRFSKRFDMDRIITIKDDQKYEKYQKLNTKIELIKSTPLNVNINSKLFVAMETRVELEGLSSNYTIPEKLMILDLEEKVELLKEFHSFFSHNDFALGETFNFVTARNQWIIRRNEFLSSFLPILSALMESGIYGRWEHYNWLQFTYLEILRSRHKMFESLKGSISQLHLEENILAYLLFKPYTAQPRAETEKPINIEFFAIFLLLYGYCVAFCGIIFLFEKFCTKRRIKLICCTESVVKK